MSRAFRSVGARLSLALLLVVAIALGIVYVSVVPSLESRLVNTRVSQLKHEAAKVARRVPGDAVILPDFVDTVSASSNARAVLFQLLSSSPQPQLTAMQDSNGFQSSDVEADRIALKAMLTQTPQHGTVERNDTRYAEAAIFIPRLNATLLLTDSLQNQLSSVHQVQHRLLLAAGAALLIALVLGYGGAWAFARRIRRLERAAERIAGGRFDEQVRDSGGDELGELALAFERMRARLAHLDDARREFVANASHELRTPLFSLAGFLELLDDEGLDESTRREFLGSMQEQVARLTKLASDLLDLSRLDAGRLSVEREPVDLKAMGEDLVEELGLLARSGGHSLQAVGDGVVVAVGDELRVLQIGRILVENALLHTPPGTRVQVRAAVRDGDAALEVEDEGPGIPVEQLEQLFERFYRLDGTRASGSGLGLAIARQLAELMDGSVDVDSVPGRTVFALVLPLHQQDRRPFPREKPVGVAS